MKGRDEGKLLERAEGFTTLRELANCRADLLYSAAHFITKKRRFAVSAVPAFRCSHQGEREKNEYL